MNRLLRLSRFDPPSPEMGSGDFYARFSQSEVSPAPVEEGLLATWFFEAFDAQWFDRHPPPETPTYDYYETAALYILELKIQPKHLRMFKYLATISGEDREGLEEDQWFFFHVSSTGAEMLRPEDLPLTVYSNLYQAGIEGYAKEVGPTDTETQAKLRRAVSTTHIADATDEQIDSALDGIAASKIEWAVVYDVGQGNAIGLCDGAGSVQTYFDLGGGVLRNAGTFPSVLTNFCWSNNPPVILSHWDFDHWSSANRDTNSLSTTWIAPRQSVGPTHLALMTNIIKSGQLLLLPSSFIGRWSGQIYLERCTGSGRNHSGLALTLSENAAGKGRQMLFPGDARYTYLPSFGSISSYLSVVVPHHGADMHNHAAPTCAGAPFSRLAYSFGGGNSFNHPRLVTRQDHDFAGWHDPLLNSHASHYEVRETANRVSGPLGHISLGWKPRHQTPSLPCGGTCQLRAQQL